MRELQTAEIVAVGSELLTPFRTDTNSLFLTSRLNEHGIDVRAKTIVGDDRAELAGFLRQALDRADVVLVTGGLGPTEDDVTRDAVVEVTGAALIEDARILEAILERFRKRGLTMPEINRRQAQVPRGADTLANPNGSAPGLWMDIGDRILVLLPGPPREMQPMFETHVAPRLRLRTGSRELRRRVLKTTGRPESQVDELAQPVYSRMLEWPIPVRATILASPGQIELHLSAAATDVAAAERALEDGVDALSRVLGPIVFSADGRTLPEVVGHQLRDRDATIAVAESCTGGLVLTRLTDVPGSSQWVLGGVIAYANDVKTAQLHVPADFIETHGAVSEPVAAAMADGIRRLLGATVGVGVTGVAGPTGGTPAKPVGMVCIAVSGDHERRVRTFNFPGDRQSIRSQAAQAALDMVRYRPGLP